MTTSTQRRLGPGKCDGSIGEDELQKGHGTTFGTTFIGGGFVQFADLNMHRPVVKCRQTKTTAVII